MSALHIPQLDDDTDMLTAALDYAGAGWYVLPARSGSKHPGSVVGNGWQAKSSRDPKRIAAWFAGTDHGIALHCGRSGAVVFDVDDPDKVPEVLRAHLVSAPSQSTHPEQPGRAHYIFAQPPGRIIGNGTGRLGGAWGEVRGLNGVIMVAPSQHADGGCYHWERTGPVPRLPDDLAELLDDASPADDAVPAAAVAAFIAEHAEGSRPDLINGWKKALAGKIERGESCHMSTVSVVTGALKEARAGYLAAADALAALNPIFTNAVALGGSTGKIRTGAAAESEWTGIVAWAVAQALGADLDEVRARTHEKMPDAVTETGTLPSGGTAEPMSLRDTHDVFRKWLGADYDTDALDAVLATVAAERLDGDPLWLLLISGPGNAKTETVQAAAGVGAIIASTISSDAGLLSGTPRKERAKGATGGLLRKLEPRGVLVIKDVTSILSMDRNTRGTVLAALREIHDGSWYRDLGTDGGIRLQWNGRIAVIGAVTTAWDAAHAVVSTMGDRFALIRMDSTTGRTAAGRKAIGNTGDETAMRAELADAVAGVIAGMDHDAITVTDVESERILEAADLVTLARTGVEYDYRGNVIDAHAPEMPTRFAKQLTQMIRGAVAIGMDRTDALRLAVRCARDSMPPMRLAIIDDLAKHPDSTASDVRRRIKKPRATVDRQLQALHMLGICDCDEEPYGEDKIRWYYSLVPGISPDALDPKCSPDLLVTFPKPYEKSVSEAESLGVPSHITGEDSAAPHCGTTSRRAGCVCTNQPKACDYCELVASKQDGSA
jgi:hypothetical protein